MAGTDGSVQVGATIRNTAREPASPSDSWVKSARMWRHEPEQDRDYPVKQDLAEWLIRQLCERDFDITAMDGLTPGQFEGHAFQFVHRRLLQDHELPVIPVILNTFDPPNQPTPRRCVALGAALRELIPWVAREARSNPALLALRALAARVRHAQGPTVKQRALLSSKGKSPDVLVMTATPIPRTLALTIYRLLLPLLFVASRLRVYFLLDDE